MYGTRSISLPSGFKSQNISSFNYTNSDIDYMYNFFNCCYADMANTFATNAKRGSYTDREKCENKKKLAFMSTGIRLLSTWNNPASANTISFNLIPVDNHIGFGNVINVSLVGFNGDTNIGPPNVLACTAGGTTVTALFNAMVANFLSLGTGITATLSGITITLTLPNPYSFPWVYIDQVNEHSGAETQLWYRPQGVYNPCVTLETVQCFVQKMQSICGCFGCKSTAQIIANNNYVSVGQLSSNPPTPVIQPNVYQ